METPLAPVAPAPLPKNELPKGIMTISIVGILFLGGSLSIVLLSLGTLLVSSFAFSGGGAYLGTMAAKAIMLVIGVAGFIGLLLMRRWGLWVVTAYFAGAIMAYAGLYAVSFLGAGSALGGSIYLLGAMPDIPSTIICLIAVIIGFRVKAQMK